MWKKKKYLSWLFTLHPILQKAELTTNLLFSAFLLGDGDYSVPLRDEAAVWLMHTRVHRAGKCCSKTEIKAEDGLFIVLYPLIWAYLGAKTQY